MLILLVQALPTTNLILLLRFGLHINETPNDCDAYIDRPVPWWILRLNKHTIRFSSLQRQSIGAALCGES
jgi:hypothetical protein